ncbi:MAG: LppC family lipoprotein [Cycloclasticus sp.]|nr:MAG: LppC family lipoprotein [Cycloclasticus sp.]
MDYCSLRLPTNIKLIFLLIIALILPSCATIKQGPVRQNSQSNALAIEAQQALSQDQYDVAANFFMQLANNSIDEQKIEYLISAADAYLRANDLLASARTRVSLDSLLAQSDKQLSNQTTLIETLFLIPEEEINTLDMAGNIAFEGWAELASLLKHQIIFEPNNPDISAWRSQYPLHTANDIFLPFLAKQAAINFKTPEKVGVFLPTKGPLSKAAYSIKKGIMTSAYTMSNRWNINVKFYDTSSTPVETLYEQAAQDGIRVIIGPLDKSNVNKIAAIQNLHIPVISLNKNGDHTSKNYYEFSLSPEDDIAQVLSLAWLKGHQKILILAPQSQHGNRLSSHSSIIWQQLGGHVLDVQTYTIKQADYSDPIKNLLQLDKSVSRYKQLRQRLNLDLEFEERRRHDADFIFLIASPREGRLIKPQLRFHRASKVPVFSTSQIYQGEINPVANRDLDGVIFCDMPWLIDKNKRLTGALNHAYKLWPNTPSTHKRLMALGYDAQQLTPHLDRLKTSDFARLDGKTGILSMTRNGTVNRQLSCGRFRRGIVKSFGLAPNFRKVTNMTQENAINRPISSNTSPF